MFKMFKDFLLIFMSCFIVNFAIAEDVQLNDSEQGKPEKILSFEVKKSEVFEDFRKSLSAESNEDLLSFIESTEKKLLAHTEFIEIINQYSHLFKKLNIIKDALPKVTMTFSFEKENWSNLVIPKELKVEVLRNLLYEEQMTKITIDLKKISVSLEKVTFRVVSEIGTKINLIKEFKEKSGNQVLRIGFILS